MTEFSTGQILIDYENDDEEGEPFKGPLVCKLDEDFIEGKLPTFYTDPAVIGTKQFYNDLLKIGLDNIDVYPVIIRDEVNSKTIDNYVLMNILGRVSCADMDASDYDMLGDDESDNLNVINKLVIDSTKVRGLDLFLVHEDTDCIVISEKVYNHIKAGGYDDIYFEEIEQA
jgi:hypothetical protein